MLRPGAIRRSSIVMTAAPWRAWFVRVAFPALLLAPCLALAQPQIGDEGLIDDPDELPMPEVVVQEAAPQDLLPAEPLPAAVFLRIQLDNGGLAGDDGDQRLIDLYSFYDGRLYNPVWVTADGPGDRARVLVTALLDAEQEALVPADYGIGAISSILGVRTSTGLADLEVRLSKALLDYGRDLSAGRVEPSQVDADHAIFPVGPSAEELLTGALNAPDFAAYLASLAPRSDNYARLKETLAAYRDLAAQAGWTRVPEGEALKPGMRQGRVAALRRRLTEAGLYDIAFAPQEPDDRDLYDEALVRAVELFQERHGIEVDGVVGPGTLAELNVSVAERVRQMELNMERRRWMEDDLGEEHVFINLADFELKVVRQDKTVHTAKVVIGLPYHSTPVFSDKMEYIVVNPYWHVPPSIAGNELLPKLQANAGALAADGIRVLNGWGDDAREVNPYSVNWRAISASGFPYKLRQDPGDGNALGRLKFIFPNKFNVYLHDTPSKSLFERTVRSFSHGCIRVQNPRRLAEVLLEGQDDWTAEEIDRAIATGRKRIVSLDRPIQVHITYLTAWVNKDGSVHFRKDVYGRDDALAGALQRTRVNEV
jgi:murein L,D-transpeptidase YcbB/YkuD